MAPDGTLCARSITAGRGRVLVVLVGMGMVLEGTGWVEEGVGGWSCEMLEVDLLQYIKHSCDIYIYIVRTCTTVQWDIRFIS